MWFPFDLKFDPTFRSFIHFCNFKLCLNQLRWFTLAYLLFMDISKSTFILGRFAKPAHNDFVNKERVVINALKGSIMTWYGTSFWWRPAFGIWCRGWRDRLDLCTQLSVAIGSSPVDHGDFYGCMCVWCVLVWLIYYKMKSPKLTGQSGKSIKHAG